MKELIVEHIVEYTALVLGRCAEIYARVLLQSGEQLVKRHEDVARRQDRFLDIVAKILIAIFGFLPVSLKLGFYVVTENQSVVG